MKNKVFLPLTAGIVLGLFGSCSDSLDDSELEVLENDLALIVYKGNIERRAESCSEYLAEGIELYADQAHDQTQSKIDDRNATAALVGGNMFDIGELYGTSTNQLLAKRYYRYIDYVNDKSDEVEEDIDNMVRIIKKNPKIIDSFFSSDSEISLSAFSSIEGLPSSITAAQFDYYRKLEMSKENKADWGKLVMGSLENPQYSPRAVLCALIIRIERLKYPSLVYAVPKEYDDEYGWEVGYDTSQAYFVTFEEDGDILEYDYTPVDYFEGYIDSKNNKLER